MRVFPATKLQRNSNISCYVQTLSRLKDDETNCFDNEVKMTPITCYLRYFIVPGKLKEFEEYETLSGELNKQMRGLVKLPRVFCEGEQPSAAKAEFIREQSCTA
jgi:hypothetical protein